MKKRIAGLLSLLLLGMLSIPKAAMACDSCWGAISAKQWFPTLSPGGGLASTNGNTEMVAFIVGHGKVYFNMGVNVASEFSDPSYPFNTLRHSQASFNFGYFVTPEISLALGLKNQQDFFKNTQGAEVRPTGSLSMQTLGVSYAHRIEDMPISINGNIAYGSASLSTARGEGAQFTGTTSGSSTYIGYEMGVGYPVTKNITLSLGYRSEQYDQLVPTSISGTLVTVAPQKIKMGGFTGGVSASF